MTTIKLKIENELNILKEQQTFSNIVRLAFNRYQDGFNQKEIRQFLRDKFVGLNSWFIQCGIKIGNQLYLRHKEKKIIFGGKYNLRQFLKKNISKEEFKAKRLLPITIIGDCYNSGNRLFNFDLENNQLTFKLSRHDHRLIKFKQPHKKIKSDLTILQMLTNNSKIAITIKLTKDYACLTFDETKLSTFKFTNLKHNRVLGIDMNPNYIGLSIIEFDKNDNINILEKQVFDLSKLTVKSEKSSSDKKSKYLVNKRKFEILEIAHQIARLVDHWKCNSVAIEDLNIKLANLNHGKIVNRLCNNVWNRNLFVGKLKSLSQIYRFKLIEVNPCYSSFIGNIMFGNENTPDMVAASIEIARRGFKKFEKSWFYPSIKDERIDEQWKQTLSRFDDWKSAFQEIKNSKMQYRILLSECIRNAVFSKFYNQKLTFIYNWL